MPDTTKPIPIEPATHGSDAIIVDAQDVEALSLEEAIELAEQKHETQMLDLTPEDEP